MTCSPRLGFLATTIATVAGVGLARHGRGCGIEAAEIESAESGTSVDNDRNDDKDDSEDGGIDNKDIEEGETTNDPEKSEGEEEPGNRSL